MQIQAILKRAIEMKASDIHITVASPIMIRVNSELVKMADYVMRPDDTKYLVESTLNDMQKQQLEMLGEVDFSYSLQHLGRFRFNVFRQRGTYSMAMRLVALEIPTLEQLKLPPILKDLTNKRRGLILVTGPTGSGKSTTLAAMINEINKSRKEHIITIEDPIEYLHRHGQSIINQREIGNDSKSFANALRASLRQDPDVILVGEMRDLETISTAITAAETGHLVMSTLHTIGAAKTIDRIIDVFSPHQQPQIRVQLASVLQAVISQQLMPKADGSGRIVAHEIMTSTPAVSNMVREGKTHQLQTVLQTNAQAGMITMDHSLIKLYKKRIIDKSTLMKYAVDADNMVKNLSLY